MADHEIIQMRPPETLTINILRLRNLKGVRGDSLTAFVRVEHNDKALGESVKIECTAEDDAELNFQSTISISFDDYMLIDELCSKPIICTAIEALPKEKKQREEKTVPLGQCTIDLLPIVLGQTKLNSTFALHATPGSPIENLPSEHPIPQIDVQITIENEILPSVTDSTVMSMTVESLYSPPDSFTSSGQPHQYLACMPIPQTAEKETLAVFAPGYVKPSADKDQLSKFKKWPIPGAALGTAVNIPNSFLSHDNLEDENGELRNRNDREFRNHSEMEKNRLVWNIERRCYLEPGASKKFQEKIAKNRFAPIEVCRMGGSGGAKGGKKDEDISYHGIVYVDLAPLLYPGVSRIRGAYKVKAFSEQDVTEKTGRKGTHAEEAMKLAQGWMARAASSPFGKGGKGKDDKKEVKKVAASKPGNETVAEGDGQISVNTEGMQYEENISYLMLEIKLSRPLIPKKELEELSKHVAEYIPPRPKFPKRNDNAQKSVEDYHNQIASVASLIIDEYRQLLEEVREEDSETGEMPENPESRYQRLIYQLNSSGKYFAFKEQLKYSVIKIVREKFLRTSTLTDQDEMEKFVSELYVYLVDQMHVCLNKSLTVEDQVPIPEPLTTTVQLKIFAQEAETNQLPELADKYYQERIARDRNDPDHWLDFGVFCLSIEDISRAEECLRECISIDQRHLEGLLLYAITVSMQQKYDRADLFFTMASRLKPDSILCWTLLSLFYKTISDEIREEMALAEAHRLNQIEAIAETRKLQENIPPIQSTDIPDEQSIQQPPISPLSLTADVKGGKPGSKLKGSARKSASAASKVKSDSRPASKLKNAANEDEESASVSAPREKTPQPSQSIYVPAITFLLKYKAYSFCNKALAQHLLDPLGGPSAYYYLSLAQVQLEKRELEEATESLKEAMQFEYENSDGWAMKGHVMYLSGRTVDAKDCYERTLAFVTPPTDLHPIYLRLASIYMSENNHEAAKNVFLQACRRSPTCVTWLGVGIACYRLGELDEAEDALTEANILHNIDPEVWAYLSLVCLKTNRPVEAEQAYKYAVKLNLSAADEDLMEEIHRTQSELGFGNPEF